MKTVIFYKSNTGFTKEYVELLKPRIECELDLPINKISNKIIKENDNIIFMGPLRNNVIQGLNKFLKKYDKMEKKNIFIFAVGIEPASNEKKENVIMANGLELYHVRLYMVQGGFDLNRYKQPKKWFYQLIFKIASKKQPELAMVKDRSVNFVSGNSLDQMVEVYYKINNVVG